MECKKWLVLWVNNRRIGSFELTPANMRFFHERYHMMLLQQDMSGTQHWELLSERRAKLRVVAKPAENGPRRLQKKQQ